MMLQREIRSPTGMATAARRRRAADRLRTRRCFPSRSSASIPRRSTLWARVARRAVEEGCKARHADASDHGAATEGRRRRRLAGQAPDEGGGGGGGGHTSADASAEAAERDDERELNRDSPTTDLQLQDVEQDVAGSLQVEYDANGRRRVGGEIRLITLFCAFVPLPPGRGTSRARACTSPRWHRRRIRPSSESEPWV